MFVQNISPLAGLEVARVSLQAFSFLACLEMAEKFVVGRVGGLDWDGFQVALCLTSTLVILSCFELS